MNRRLTAASRWGIVILYALIGFAFTGGGMTGGEFTAMVVLGAIALIYIVLMDWIAGGERAE